MKERLLSKIWHIQDPILSPYPARQLYVTVQSILSSDCKFQANDKKWDVGVSLPPVYTLPYLNPLTPENELGFDGYDNYNAPLKNGKEMFKRRMWVSGSFWFNPLNKITFGDGLQLKEWVERVRVGNNGVICDYIREFYHGNENIALDTSKIPRKDNDVLQFIKDANISVLEKRRFGYLSENYKTIPTEDHVKEQTDNIVSTWIKPSLLSSFRMSAILFNAHMIHYSSDYAKSEGYPKIVVEAPLQIATAFQFWMNNNAILVQDVEWIKYKVGKVLWVNEKARVCFNRNDNIHSIWIDNGPNTSRCFEGTIKTIS